MSGLPRFDGGHRRRVNQTLSLSYGHAYSERALAECSLPGIEETLWSALAQAEERESLLREMVQANGQTDSAGDYERQAQQMRGLIERLRELARDRAFDCMPAQE